MTDTEKFFEIFQHLNPTLVSAVQMLTHHVRQGSSLVVQLWGPKGSGKQKLVDAIKHRLTHDRPKAENPKHKLWEEIVIDFNNEMVPNPTTRKRYSQLFLSAVIEAMKEHNYRISSLNDRSGRESDVDSADSSSGVSTDDSEDDLSLKHYAPAAKREKRGSFEPRPSLPFPRAAHMSEENRNRLQALFQAPTRHIVSEILKILKYLCTSGNRVIIVLRRFDRCVRSSEKLLYGLLNYISDSSSSIVLITTTHLSTVDLEKRISSRYNPFRLPVLLGSENISSRILNSVGTRSALGKVVSKSSVADEMGSSMAEKMCDAGLTVQLLCFCLQYAKKSRTISTIPKTPSEAFTELTHCFDPLLRFYKNFNIPPLYQLFDFHDGQAQLTDMEAVGLLFPWLEHVRGLMRECVLVVVAISISLERTSSKGGVCRMFPNAQKKRSLLLGDHSWLKNRPAGSQTSWFSIEYMLQSIFPMEGGIFNFKKYRFANRNVRMSWLFSGSCFEGLLQKYDLHGGNDHTSDGLVSDEVWTHTMIWLIVEYGILHQPNPSMVALSFPPHHCIYVIRQRLQTIVDKVKAEIHLFESHHETHTVKTLLMPRCMNILKAVDSEIRWILDTFNEYTENVTKTRNAL